MRLELSNLLTNPDLSKDDIDRHYRIPFFDPKLLERPEFRIKNNLIQLKESDVALLNEALKTVEDEKAQAAALCFADSLAAAIDAAFCSVNASIPGATPANPNSDRTTSMSFEPTAPANCLRQPVS